jgi:hypothetical protein
MAVGLLATGAEGAMRDVRSIHSLIQRCTWEEVFSQVVAPRGEGPQAPSLSLL